MGETQAGVSRSHPAGSWISKNKGTGQDIRALRKARGITLATMASELGRSVGWLSQVERGLSAPSITDIKRFADVLGVSISFFFGHEVVSEQEQGAIVRSGRRRTLGTNESGLLEELLSPDLGGSFEILRSVFVSGGAIETPLLRATEEAGYLVSGLFDIEIDGHWFSLQPGDSFRFASKPFRWKNPGDEDAVVIWVIAPPVY